MSTLRELLVRLRSARPLWDRRTISLFTNREILEYLRGPGWIQADTRHYRDWRLTLEKSLDWDWRLANPWPCYAYEAIDFLEDKVSPHSVIAEFGCGTSTLWWAARAGRVIAVEHDPQWANRIRHAAPSHVDIRLVRPQSQIPTRPEYASEVIAGSFEAYVHALDDLPDGTLDILAVDGRARAGCMLHAHQKLSDGGLLILDNFHRARYQSAIHQLCNWGWFALRFTGNGPYLAAEQHTMIFSRRPL